MNMNNWNIFQVALWNEVSGSSKLITTAAYCQNGKDISEQSVFFLNVSVSFFIALLHLRQVCGGGYV